MHHCFNKSLKSATREHRTKTGSEPVAYKISEKTRIGHMTMAKLLAHTQTKQDLTVFLGNKIIEQSMDKNIQTIVAYSNVVKSTTYPVDELACSQEEADTKLILHAYYAAKRGASKIDIFSPDTDVFVLAIHHFQCFVITQISLLGKVTNSDQFPSEIFTIQLDVPELLLCWVSMHSQVQTILVVFLEKESHHVGKILNKRITAFFMLLLVCLPIHQFRILMSLSLSILSANYISQQLKLQLPMNCDGGCSTEKNCQAEKLPPTKGALVPAVKRAQHQVQIWANAIISNPEASNQESYGWQRIDGLFVSVMTTLPPAPDAIVELVKCGCSKTKCGSARCKCVANKLVCFELCSCDDTEETCLNRTSSTSSDSDNDSDIE